MATKLEILITAQNLASKDILKLQKDINTLTVATAANTTGNTANAKSSKAMATGFAGAGAAANSLKTTLISLGAIVLFAGAVRTLVQFEQAMANVRAVMLSVGDATAETEAQFEALEAEARRLGATTIFSATEAANGLEFLGRAGFTAQQAISALEGTLNLAAAGGLELGRAADIASNIISGFNINASEAGRVADVLALTAASSNTNVEQLGEAMKFVAPIAASLGVSLETTSAAIGQLSNAGLQGSLAGTGLRKVLLKLAAPSKSLNTVLDKLNLTFDQVNSQTNELSDIMELFAAQGLSAADAIEIFGDRGAPAALAMANVSDKLRELNAELLQAEGQAGIMADIMSDTLAGAFKALTSALSETVLQMGDDGLGAILRDTVDLLAGVVRTLNGTQDPLNKNAVLYRKAADAVETLYEVLKILLLLKVGGFFVSALSAIISFGTAMAAAAGGVGVLSVSVRGLGLALGAALGPIGLIITLGAALLSFATSDAPAAIAALEDTAKATNRLTEAFKNASTGAINAQLIKAESNASKLGKTLDDLDAQLEDATSVGGGGSGKFGTVGSFANQQAIEDIRAQIAATETELALVDSNIETLAKLRADAKVRDAEAEVAHEKALLKIESEADQNQLAAISAQNKSILTLEQARIEQSQKLAKANAAIELSRLQKDFDAEKAFLEGQQTVELDDGEFQDAQLTNAALIALEQEFFAEKRRIAEDQFAFDLELIDRKRQAVLQAAQDERNTLAVNLDIAVGNSGDARERAALQKKFDARISIINTNQQLEIEALKDKDEIILTNTIAAQEKLITAEEKALTSRNEAFAKAQTDAITDSETAQKKEFQDRIDRIVAQAERERLAAQRDVDTGAESGFGLGNRLDVIDQETVTKLQQVKDDMNEFSETSQDPILEERFIALGDVIDEFANRANVNLERVKTSLSTGLGDALFEIADGTKTASEAFQDFAREFLREIAKMILQQIAFNAVKAAFGGAEGGGLFGGLFSGGGLVPKFAEGGFITGKGTATSDSIPARLSNGEYVMNAAAVRGYGVNFMEAINRMKLPQQQGLPKFAITRPQRMKFAEGGVVDSGAGSQAPQQQGSLRVINVVDVDRTEDFLNSSAGEEVVVNLIRKNGSAIKQVLR